MCSKSEAHELIKKAEREAAEITRELRAFYTGNIEIRVYINRHVMGSSVAGDLMVNGEVCCTYDPVDLCFLELNELMMKRIIEIRKGGTDNAKR